jgi:hypothetical protein
MDDGDFRSLLKRGLKRHPIPPDSAPWASRRAVGTELKEFDSHAIVENDMQTHRTAEMETRPTPDPRIQQHHTPTPLDDIAALVQSLTYGEMIELSEAIWKSRSEGAVTAESLPAVLHRWSASHLAAAQTSGDMRLVNRSD